MRNTREAVRYGIETLGVSPDKMFALIESSNGYQGEDYGRWLANEIIKIAEKDGMGFSQLLVKKFAIIQSLIEEYADNSIREDWAEVLEEIVGGEVYSVGVEGVGNALEDVDWFNGLDFDSENSEFVRERLPEDVRDSILGNEAVSFFCRLSSEAPDKGSELWKQAKDAGIVCKSEGALMLYRFCSLITAFESCTENLHFAILTSTGFLTDKENAQIWKYFLSYFKYTTGCVIEAGELLKDAYTGGEYVFLMCEPRVLGDDAQDGILLKKAKLVDKVVEYSGITKRYTKSEVDMLTSLVRSKPPATDTVPVIGESGKLKPGYGVENALGYMQYDKARNLKVSAQPVDGVNNLPITKENFFDVAVYYAVTKSLERFGFSKSITEVVSGNPEYSELLYNCIPLFLFDADNRACDMGVLRYNGSIMRASNGLDVLSSEFIKSVLERGEIYFSFEAKELLALCRGYLEFLNKQPDYNAVGKTFEDVRLESDHVELNKQYIQALTNIKDYISMLYRKIE